MVQSVGRLLLSSSLCVPFAALAHAQSVDATLIGKVRDTTGAAVPGATVTAVSEANGLARSTVTDAEGRYRLFQLPASTYTVRAGLDGFAPSTQRAHTLHVGSTIAIDFVLKVAGVAESVTVRGALSTLETTSNVPTRIVQTSEIDTLPVIKRNFNDLAALSPGVTKTGVYGGVDISGSRDFQNAYQLDGVSAERHHLGDQRIAYAQDWVREFQVLTSQFNVEFGQATGGVINVITRSGTNQRTGRLYGFLRNDRWDATPAFATSKAPLDERRLGGTIGGPIVKDRIFYFGGIERFQSASSSIVNSAFVAENGTFPSTEKRTLTLAKIELFPNRTHTVRLRYNGQLQQATGASIGGISTEEHGRFSDTHAHEVVSGWTWIVSPLMNEARGAWSRAVPEGGCNFARRNPPGTWFERSHPGVQLGCPVNFGTIAEEQFQFIDNLLWTRGTHDVKLGLQTSRTRSSGDFRNFRDGRYSFERDLPFVESNPLTHPFSFVKIDGPTEWDVAGWSVGLFAQDHWRVTDALALNVGVRYDLDGSLTALNPLVRVDRGLHRIEADLNNVAPRAGFAWTPLGDDKRTVIRGGAGLYYDQNHNNVATLVLLNNLLVDGIVTLNANSPLLNPFWPDTARAKSLLASALGRNTVPGSSQLGSIAGSTNSVDRNLQIPSSTQVSAGVARELRHWLNASADLVYAKGNNLYILRNTNLDPATFKAVNPNYTSINSFGNGGSSRYRALQLQANIVPRDAHFLKFAYTLAANRSNTGSTLSAGTATNPFDYSEDEGPADNDVRHGLSVNGAALLPMGVQLSGIASYRSGLPFSATTHAPRPDGKPFAWRPEPRNARRGDSNLSLDLRLAKRIVFGTRHLATVFAEVFNLTNRLNYSHYIGTITSSRFGEPTQAGPRRRLQLGARIDF